MTASYQWVQWNRHKKTYDVFVGVGAIAYLVAFMALGSMVYTGDNAIWPPILALRAFATLALVLLHVILCIGPLARMSSLYAPLLYNRRHLGVMMFVAAFLHSVMAVLFYGAFGVISPISGLFDGYHSFNSVGGFPFEWLGLGALVILFAMAATSHDFWLAFLSPRAWKSLHMMVYVAYGLVLFHVALGILQAERNPLYVGLIMSGAVVVVALHLAAGLKERSRDAGGIAAADGQWVDIGAVNDFEHHRGRVICLKNKERVGVFRHDDGISAVSNVCAHQGGPLGEGQIVDGCITCPWHGYQYLPGNGQSPPPYTEKIPTYELRIEGGRVMLNPTPKEPGTAVTPATESANG